MSDFITPARARAIRAGIDAERQDAIRAGELPAGAKQGVGVQGTPAAWRPVTPGTPTMERPVGGALPPGGPAGRSCSVCGTHPARQFMNAWLCPAHQPRFPTPDPTRTADALRRRRRMAFVYLRSIAR